MRWTSWATLFLGAWLLSSPLTFGYQSPPLSFSDFLFGTLIIALSISDLLSPQSWKKWGLCFTGVWLIFAPLLLWAPTAGIYGNNTLVGTLMIVFAAVLPSQHTTESENPAGWSYNPASWHHRTPVIVLALMGFFIARHMAAFQMGHTRYIWDPFFGNGTERVLTSDVAKAFPVSDAGLGAACYLLEALSGVIGDVRRWRTMPWMVFLFFVLVVPAGVVSILLIMLQPMVVGAWCTLCLITAFLTLISIPPAVDEVFASWQFLWASRREGRSMWKVFWNGGPSLEKKTVPASLSSPQKWKLMSGLDMTWNLSLSSLIGVWVILLPQLFETPRLAANSDTIMGALVATVAVLATAEPIRSLRFLNVLFGLWILATPFVFDGIKGGLMAHHLILGIAVIFLSGPKGAIQDRYGSWDKYIR